MGVGEKDDSRNTSLKKPHQTQPFLEKLTTCLQHVSKIQALSDFILLRLALFIQHFEGI